MPEIQWQISGRERAGAGVPMRSDGTFEIWGLDPGRYWISVFWRAKRLSTSTIQIDVETSNIDGMELRMVPESDIAGKLEGMNLQASGPGPGPQRMIQLRQFGSGYPSGELPVSRCRSMSMETSSCNTSRQANTSWPSCGRPRT
jgi:hypothetical protein